MSKRHYNRNNVVAIDEAVEVEEIQEEVEEAKVVKTPWSLKKKLIVAGGIVGGFILGALALGMKKPDEEEPETEGLFEEEQDEFVIEQDTDEPNESAETFEADN